MSYKSLSAVEYSQPRRKPFCLPRRKWPKPSALVSGINQENGVYPMGVCHECVYKNRVKFWLLAILVSLAFTCKKVPLLIYENKNKVFLLALSDFIIWLVP